MDDLERVAKLLGVPEVQDGDPEPTVGLITRDGQHKYSFFALIEAHVKFVEDHAPAS